MPEPDFAGLRAEAEQGAKQPEFAAIERRATRLRARQRGTAAAAALTLIALVAVAAVTAGSRPGGIPGAPDPSSSGRVEKWPQLRYAGGADASHLYAETLACPDCPIKLIASTDGGRTWQPRSETAGREVGWPGLLPVGPDTLLRLHMPPATPGSPDATPRTLEEARKQQVRQAELTVSTDGGVSWHAATVDTAGVAAVPQGGRVVDCSMVPGDVADHRCRLYAVDAATGRVAPLANQPPITGGLVGTASAAGIWVSGQDPSSGQAAVAVSHDGGRTWSTHLFPDAPGRNKGSGTAVDLVLGRVNLATSGDGRTAYALFGPEYSVPDVHVNVPTGTPGPTSTPGPTGGSGGTPSAPAAGSGSPKPGDTGTPEPPGEATPTPMPTPSVVRPRQLYRTTDGGVTWQKVEPGSTMRPEFLSDSMMVARDGSLVVVDRAEKGPYFLVGRDGGTRFERRDTLPGLPRSESPSLGVLADGRYLSWMTDGAYVSDDGLNWRPVLSV